MKLITTSLNHGRLVHKEIELPEGFLDLSLEMDSGMIFQIVSDQFEDSVHIRETTFRKLSIEPNSSNGIKVKGI